VAAGTKAPYGDVTYADPGYQADKQKRYPLDTEEHIRAAWTYISQSKNASQYSPGDSGENQGENSGGDEAHRG
jgi:hypothetical protein